MPNPDGSHIWYELATRDPDAAQDFYGNVMGWKARDSGMGGGMDYRLMSAPDGQDVAGVTKPPQGASLSVWLGVVGVSDVDATVTKATKRGASVKMPAADIPGVGRFALLADPQGVPFYVMRGEGEQQSTAFKPMADGHCAWNELVTSDQSAALDFYTRLFGWEKGDTMPMGEMGDYRFLNHGGEMIGAVMNRPKDGPPPAWNYYFRVKGVDAAVERIRKGGGRVTSGPMEVPGGDWAVNAIDPQGAAFGLVGPKT